MADHLNARSFRELFGDISGDLSLLVTQTLGLAQAELRVATAASVSALIGVAVCAMTAVAGFFVLVSAVVLGAIALGLPPWAAALAVGVVLAGGGGLGARAFVGRLTRVPLDLPDTRASLTETAQWLKSQTTR